MDLEGMLREALEMQASDVHFIPEREHVRRMHRIRGNLVEGASLTTEEFCILLQRVKAAAGMNISEKRLPQDGMLRLGGETVRVSTVRSLLGESLVVRLFIKRVPALRDSGMEEVQRERLLTHLLEGSGILLISGETGMGKSTTLYSLMQELSALGKKVLSIEDPVEQELPGVIQCPINEAAGITYERSIFAALRQDPDYICIGEVRSVGTAEALIRAGLTGHRVLSTIHAKGYANTLNRLCEFGVSRDYVDAAVGLVVSQRLVTMGGRRKVIVELEEHGLRRIP